ncbi:MAG: hypothetical protein ABJF88_04475 [Rhodothermales bacterium]
MAVAHLFVIALAGVLGVGCTSVHTVSRSDAEALAGVTEDLGGKTVEVVHGVARERGTRLRVHEDSTRWLAEDTPRSVPTDSVRALVVDPRASNVKLWAGVGAAFFGLGTALSCNDDDILIDDLCVYLVSLAAVGGALTFGFYAVVGSERVEYRLVE